MYTFDGKKLDNHTITMNAAFGRTYEWSFGDDSLIAELSINLPTHELKFISNSIFVEEQWSNPHIDSRCIFAEDFKKALIAFNPAWFNVMNPNGSKTIEEILNLSMQFMDQILDSGKYQEFKNGTLLPKLQKIVFGDAQAIKQNTAVNQEIFREWVRFLGLNVEEITKNFPELTTSILNENELRSGEIIKKLAILTRLRKLIDTCQSQEDVDKAFSQTARDIKRSTKEMFDDLGLGYLNKENFLDNVQGFLGYSIQQAAPAIVKGTVSFNPKTLLGVIFEAKIFELMGKSEQHSSSCFLGNDNGFIYYVKNDILVLSNTDMGQAIAALHLPSMRPLDVT
jgi:hypothetical protein